MWRLIYRTTFIVDYDSFHRDQHRQNDSLSIPRGPDRPESVATHSQRCVPEDNLKMIYIRCCVALFRFQIFIFSPRNPLTSSDYEPWTH